MFISYIKLGSSNLPPGINNYLRLLGEIGKLSELKIRCREACGFESHSK